MIARTAEILRFLIAGGLTTVASYALYLALDLVMHYQVAFAIAYAVGVGIQYLLHSFFVFRVARSAKAAAGYPVLHVFQYAFNALLLELLVRAGVDSALAVPIVIVAAVPVSYVVSRAWLGYVARSARSN